MCSVLFLALALTLPWGDLSAQEEPKASSQFQTGIDRATNFYSEGNISEAERTALKLLSENGGLSYEDRFLLNRLLAFCAIANDDEDAGGRYFIEAMKLNPGMSHDPLTWSPKIRRVYDEARREYQRQQDESRMKRYAAEAELCRRASLRSLYFPGSGQYAKGQPVRGTIVGVLFVGTLGAAIYSQMALPEVQQRYHDASTREDAESLWGEYRDAQYRANLTAMATVLVYCYGFFDSLWIHPSPDESHGN